MFWMLTGNGARVRTEEEFKNQYYRVEVEGPYGTDLSSN